MLLKNDSLPSTGALHRCNNDPQDTQATWACPLDQKENGRPCENEPTCVRLGMLPRRAPEPAEGSTSASALTKPALPSPNKTSAPETLCRSGAMALATRLERYWHERGYPGARFWAEPIAERFDKVGTYELYRVVSNLVNGLPPRFRE